ncbi:MAG: Exodeoxyribonuclease alpha chain [Fibrobacteres bacterium]|nr:Exodeoxyribonuclease alpha chain [Fibrobacterota bacterium]
MIQKATVKTVTFHNPENGYSVLRMTDPVSKKPFTAIGRFPKLSPGESLEIEGEWTKHDVFGEQFKAAGYKLLAPDSLEAIERYLGGGVLKGVGPGLAKKLVARFGLETFDVLDNHPERLSEIPRLSGKAKEALLLGWRNNKSMREVLYFLQAYNLSANLSERIYKEYGAQAVTVLRANPYRLAHEMWGVGFLKADEIARKLGFGLDSYERIEAGVEYALGRSAEEGHVFLHREELMNRAQALLQCDPEKIVFTIDGLSDSDASQVRHDGEDRFYLPWLFHGERGIARRAAMLSFSPKPIPAAIIAAAITGAEASFANGRSGGFEYSEQQRGGIRNAVARGLFLLTGGPGTGKTTTVLGILEVFKRAGLRVRLAAPTGRAAKRLSEVTGHPASTIHRLLKYDPSQKKFTHDEIAPLDMDALVVDELSMIDTVLMYGLLKAVKQGTRLILIGDPDQLPSVGPGKVLAEFIRSGCVPHLHLDRIFRQAEESMIVAGAHRIHQGLPPVTLPMPPAGQASMQAPPVPAAGLPAHGHPPGSIHFAPMRDAALGPAMVAELVAEALPRLFGYDPRFDVQVLTPMNQGPLGTLALNQALQERLNPATPISATLEHKDRRYRTRDKVMQLRNNYDKNVFNGDIGYISAVSKASRTVTVDFDGEPVVYEGEELDQLGLAYAVTVHKSQGSEFKAVVMLASRAHWIMLQRNLLYTGITRARERLILAGTEDALRRAVENNPSVNRNTRLAEALRSEMTQYAF